MDDTHVVRRQTEYLAQDGDHSGEEQPDAANDSEYDRKHNDSRSDLAYTVRRMRRRTYVLSSLLGHPPLEP